MLFVSSEAAPLVKTGGLGDVSGALPAALRALGLDVRLMLPGYPAVLSALALRPAARGVALLPAQAPVDLLEGNGAGGTPLLVVASPLFERQGGPYQDETGIDWPDNALRFATLARAASLLGSAACPLRWRAQLVHANDWQSGLACAYLAHDPARVARSVQSIHNVAFSGAFDASLVPALGLPWSCYRMEGIEFYGRLSFLKAGVYYADQVTTVSPRYAREIQTEAFGAGMHGLLATRAASLTGILNGIDTSAWDPRRDPHLARRYGERSLWGKRVDKRALQRQLGLAENAGVPLLGVVSRLTWQKGSDLLPAAMALLADLSPQLALLGSGEREMERALGALARAYPQRVRVVIGYDEILAHRIEAGADVFLMPSRFEPCGLNQMYSMRYGTPPVVRGTGGLVDSVVDAQAGALARGEATGFVFGDALPEALAGAIRRALALRADARAWRAVQLAGMRRDFSWARSAREYVRVYERALRAT